MKPIETERLILRKFAESDFEVVHSYASDPENIVYMPWGSNTGGQTRAFIRMAIAKAEESPCANYQFAVVLKATGQLIGACDIAQSGDKGGNLEQRYWIAL